MWQTIWDVRCLQNLMCWNAWTPFDGTILRGHGTSEYWANWQRAIQVSFGGSSRFLVRDFLLLILCRYHKPCPNFLPLSTSTNTLHAMINCILWTVFQNMPFLFSVVKVRNAVTVSWNFLLLASFHNNKPCSSRCLRERATNSPT